MTKELAEKVYDILVNIGGANADDKSSFVLHHAYLERNAICQEWRFQGKLGYGGKYYSQINIVDCYLEDRTPKRIKLIEEINKS